MIKVKARKSKNFIDSAFGLMFGNTNYPFFLNTRFGIHTFFVRSTIVVYILDDDFIVKRISRVKPRGIFFWDLKYQNVLEVPISNIVNKKIKVGDRVRIV